MRSGAGDARAIRAALARLRPLADACRALATGNYVITLSPQDFAALTRSPQASAMHGVRVLDDGTVWWEEFELRGTTDSPVRD